MRCCRRSRACGPGTARAAFRLIDRTIALAAAAAVAGCGFAILLREPAIRLLFQRGSFTAESTRMAAAVFLGLAPSVIGWSLVELTSRALFALERAWLPAAAAFVPLLINMAVSFAMGESRPQYIGIGASVGLLAGFLLVFGLAHARRRTWLGEGQGGPGERGRGPGKRWVRRRFRKLLACQVSAVSLSNSVQVQDFEVEAVGREEGDGAFSEVRPRLVSLARDGGVQVEEELVREAVDGGRLPERQAQAHGLVERDLRGADGFLDQQRDETAASGVRPQVGVEQPSQAGIRAEGDFALADPFQDGVAPLPLGNERAVLVREPDGKIQSALLARILTIDGRQHVFRIDNHRRVVQHFRERRPIQGRVYQQRRQFVRFVTRNSDVNAHGFAPPSLTKTLGPPTGCRISI